MFLCLFHNVLENNIHNLHFTFKTTYIVRYSLNNDEIKICRILTVTLYDLFFMDACTTAFIVFVSASNKNFKTCCCIQYFQIEAHKFGFIGGVICPILYRYRHCLSPEALHGKLQKTRLASPDTFVISNQ